MTIQITETTRRDIIDSIFLEKINLYGRLEEIDFLSRIWDLDSMPSLDSRFKNATGDICCKSILNNCNVSFSKSDDLPKLVKLTVKQLELTPKDIPDKVKAGDTIKRLLSNLAVITQGIAELRNHYGTGHGKLNASKGLQPRHAKLAVGAASTLAVFLSETHDLRKLNKDKKLP